MLQSTGATVGAAAVEDGWLRRLFTEANLDKYVDQAASWAEETGCQECDLISEQEAVEKLVERLQLRSFDAKRLQRVLVVRRAGDAWAPRDGSHESPEAEGAPGNLGDASDGSHLADGRDPSPSPAHPQGPLDPKPGPAAWLAAAARAAEAAGGLGRPESHAVAPAQPSPAHPQELLDPKPEPAAWLAASASAAEAAASSIEPWPTPANSADDWTEHVDPATGRPFYHSGATGKSSWRRPPLPERPQESPAYFQYVLRREGDASLGIELRPDRKEGCYTMGKVAPGGLASMKNARLAQAPGLTDHQIREGDRLLVVNGKKGLQETKEELRHSTFIHIHCQRPSSIELKPPAALSVKAPPSQLDLLRKTSP